MTSSSSTSAICAESCPRMSITTNALERICRSTRIVRTHARSCHARSERWSPSLKSVACIVATNASPPDSSQIPADQLLLGGPYALVCGSMNQTVFDRDQAELLAGLTAARLISVHRSDMTLVADRNPDQIEFSVATAGGASPKRSRTRSSTRFFNSTNSIFDIFHEIRTYRFADQLARAW